MQIMISGIAVGVILLQTIIFAPTIFTTIDAEPAGKLLRALFPKFFKFLAMLGVLTILTCIFSSQNGAGQWTIGIITVVVPIVCLLMIPATNRATDEGHKERFKLLHTLSVLFTLTVLIANLSMPYVATLNA